jgi:hypothetical protein
LKVRSFAILGNFAAGALASIFSIETGVPEKENFRSKDRKKIGPTTKILCSKTPIMMENFNGNALAQKYTQKGKRRDFQALIPSHHFT